MAKEKKCSVKENSYKGINAIFINCTLTRTPEKSHTETLIKLSERILKKNGIKTQIIRPVDYDIAFGVQPDMTKKGWAKDDWPKIFKKVMKADIVFICTPIWLGQISAIAKLVIERLYAHSGETNAKGQYKFYGQVGATLITGNEDGIKHCAMEILYSMQHLGFTIPPQADAGWIGEAGPGPSYGDKGKVGFDNDFTNRNVTFLTWNVMHFAQMLKKNKGIPSYGNILEEWDTGCDMDFPNPEYRSKEKSKK